MKLVIRTPRSNTVVKRSGLGFQVFVDDEPIVEVQMVGEFAQSLVHKAKEKFRLKGLEIVAPSFMDGDDDPINSGVPDFDKIKTF